MLLQVSEVALEDLALLEEVGGLLHLAGRGRRGRAASRPARLIRLVSAT